MSKEKVVAFLKKAKPPLWLVRKIVQGGFFVLLNCAILGVNPVPLLLPVLECLGMRSKVVGCSLGAIQIYLSRPEAPLLAVGLLIVIAVILGRSSCAWVCPFGFVMDLIALMNRKPIRVSRPTDSTFKKAKYGILLVIFLVSGSLALSLIYQPSTGEAYKKALGSLAEGPFCAFCPAGSFFVTLPEAIMYFWGMAPGGIGEQLRGLPPTFWIRLIILAGVFYAAYYVPRAWCRYVCPLGAFLALFSRFSLLGIVRSPARCDKCGKCNAVCPMNIRVADFRGKVSHPECIYCLECIYACDKKALKLKFP